jgi:hypothetical protein
LIDHINGIVESHAFAVVDGGNSQGRCQVGLARTGAAGQDQVGCTPDS